MKTLGIIAEYNPFHTGHFYHINKSIEITGSDCVIAVMSGNFVQRGNPAYADKYFRAECALRMGVDVVIELPVVYAGASAEYFAKGAVTLLDSLNCIDYLSFGMENGDPSSLDSIAKTLLNEPAEYKMYLKKYLEEGNTLPLARQKALIEYSDNSSIASIISSPNNILAIEYVKALKRIKSNIQPISVIREGNAYHDDEITSMYPSATSLRKILDSSCNNLTQYVGKANADAIEKSYNRILPMDFNDFSQMIFYAINSNYNNLEGFFDVSDAIANRIRKKFDEGIYQYKNIDEFILALKTKDITYTRASRCLIHILLGIRKEIFSVDSIPSYARILGCTKKGRDFLKTAKKTASIPLITNVADSISQLKETEKNIFEKDIFASNVYNLAVFQKYKTVSVDDYRHRPIIL